MICALEHMPADAKLGQSERPKPDKPSALKSCRVTHDPDDVVLPLVLPALVLILVLPLVLPVWSRREAR